MINASLIPKELLENEMFSKGMDGLTNAFYMLIKEASETISNEMPFGDELKPVLKTLTANSCKEAFDRAYARFISGG